MNQPSRTAACDGANSPLAHNVASTTADVTTASHSAIGKIWITDDTPSSRQAGRAMRAIVLGVRLGVLRERAAGRPDRSGFRRRAAAGQRQRLLLQRRQRLF